MATVKRFEDLIAWPARNASKTSLHGLRGGRAKSWYYTYVLLSNKDGKFYIGWTNDLNNRLKQHAGGKVGSTKLRRPLEPVYYEACRSKEKAIKREKYFKTGFGRRFLKNRI